MSINDVRKEKMMTTQTKQPNSRYPQVCPTGGARKPRALDRQLVGCALYTNPPPFVLHQNHTEQVRFSYLSSDAKVQECPWFEDDRLFSDLLALGILIPASSLTLRRVSSSMRRRMLLAWRSRVTGE